MAKTSMIAREIRERELSKNSLKKGFLLAILKDMKSSDEEKWEAQVKLQKLPRDASPCRHKGDVE